LWQLLFFEYRFSKKIQHSGKNIFMKKSILAILAAFLLIASCSKGGSEDPGGGVMEAAVAAVP
jgi:hypothetical protein